MSSTKCNFLCLNLPKMICARKEIDRQGIAVICIFAILNVCWGMMASLPVSFRTTKDAVFIMMELHFKCNDNSFQGAPLSYASFRERRLWVSNQPRWGKGWYDLIYFNDALTLHEQNHQRLKTMKQIILQNYRFVRKMDCPTLDKGRSKEMFF